MNLKKLSFISVALASATFLLCSAAADPTKPATPPTNAVNAKADTANKPVAPSGPVNVKVVNFKKCVEASKIGKQEQANFENLKTQMEKVLEEKEESLADISNKFNDPDYLDSLTPEAENELKHKYRALTQEYNQIQSQCYQAMQQSNMKIVQNLQDEITEASNVIAKKNNIDVICNEESCFFYSPKLDISNEVIEELDKKFDSKKDKPISDKTAQ